MEEIKEHLHLNVMTVTGKTLGENLDELRANGFYEKCNHWLDEFNKRYQLHPVSYTHLMILVSEKVAITLPTRNCQH